MPLPLPRPLKQQLGRIVGRFSRDAVVRELRRLAAGREPVVAGPWLGEVGFELLYWIPFLAWAMEEAGIEPSRLVVLSRGGTSDWYRHVAGRYHDALERMTPDEFRRRNDERAALLGEQKQAAMTVVDRAFLEPVLRTLGVDQRRVLHPSLMYRLYNPYWFGHAGPEWVEAHARFVRLEPPPRIEALRELPDAYTAVKFYYNESFPATPGNRAVARTVMADLLAAGPVVSLSTGLTIDDHEAWEEEATLAARGIQAGLAPASNLAVQGSVVAHAMAWSGTYGGFAYLAPFYAVPSAAYYSDRDAFSARHLTLAQRVFARLSPAPLLTLHDARRARATA